MTKSLSATKNDPQHVLRIKNLINSNTKGLGFWAAVDAANKMGLVVEIDEEGKYSVA